MIRKKLNWVFSLARAGINAQSDSHLARRVIFTNILFISLPLVYVVFMAIDYRTYLLSANYLKFDQYIVPIIIGICLLCLLLNRHGYISVSRNLFLFTWPLLVHILPIVLQGSPPDYYFAFPVGVIFHSMMIQLMFSYRNQPYSFFGWMTVNVATLLFIPAILSRFDFTHAIPATMLSSRYYPLDFILYWLLLNLVVFYTIIETEKYIDRVHRTKALVEEQKRELAQLNQNLERVVRQRTKALEEQTKKLMDYAFYNAHTLRGPFCRVKGLIHLRDISGEDSDEINSRLIQSLDELDQKIQEIQLMLQHDERIKVH